jgi:hypothetical protein
MGDTIRTYSNHAKDDYNKMTAKKGSNVFIWNLSYPPAKKFDGMVLWWGSLSGAKAVPGNYTISLRYKGATSSQNFSVLRSPNSEGSELDIRQQFDFIKSVNDKVSDAHKTVIDIRSAKKQITDYVAAVEDRDLKDFAKQIDSLSTYIEQALYQTKNRSNQDPLNFPIKLTNKLAHLTALAQMNGNDFKPTDSMVEVRDVLFKELNQLLEKWDDIRKNMVPKFNQMIRDKQKDTIILK